MSKLFVFIAWKDIRHPAAGGAELVHHELSKRLILDGHRVIHLVPGYRQCLAQEIMDGVEIRRIGQSVLRFPFLLFYFWRHLREKTDVLIDVFNCVGSFSCLFFKGPSFFFIHHIQDKMWFYQTTFYGVPNVLLPFINLVGYFLEKIQLLSLAFLFRGGIMTVSPSTRDELSRYGFRRSKMSILREGTTITPLAELNKSLDKEQSFTVIMIGPRKSKRPMETLKGFELFSAKYGEAILWVVGWGTEEEKMREYAEKKHISNVRFFGKVSDEKRNELLQRAHVLCTTPVKEGWGLIVIEANACGTPVVAYDVPGIRDALAFNNGLCSPPCPEKLAERMEEVYRLVKENPSDYCVLRQRSLDIARQMHFNNTYDDFLKAIET